MEKEIEESGTVHEFTEGNLNLTSSLNLKKIPKVVGDTRQEIGIQDNICIVNQDTAGNDSARDSKRINLDNLSSLDDPYM